MFRAKSLTLSLLVLSVCSVSIAQDTGDLKITFKYRGKPHKQQLIMMPVGGPAFCGNGKMLDESLIVNPKNNGIKNVVVYVYTGRRGVLLPPQQPKKNIQTVANKNCLFEPRIAVTQVGDTLRATNPDPIGHNFNIPFFNNPAVNINLPPGKKEDLVLGIAEPAPIPFECNIHPWMSGYVLVLDHPYAAISNEDGELIIKNLPLGKMVFRAWHEVGTFKSQIFVDGKQDKWRLNKFEVNIKKGLNEFGMVEVPANQFAPKVVAAN